jgi:hypothetical protein
VPKRAIQKAINNSPLNGMFANSPSHKPATIAYNWYAKKAEAKGRKIFFKAATSFSTLNT